MTSESRKASLDSWVWMILDVYQLQMHEFIKTLVSALFPQFFPVSVKIGWSKINPRTGVDIPTFAGLFWKQ